MAIQRGVLAILTDDRAFPLTEPANSAFHDQSWNRGHGEGGVG